MQVTHLLRKIIRVRDGSSGGGNGSQIERDGERRRSHRDVVRERGTATARESKQMYRYTLLIIMFVAVHAPVDPLLLVFHTLYHTISITRQL